MNAEQFETYEELRERHQKAVNAFPMFFAFSKEQFAEGMRKFGLSLDDTDMICASGAGGYLLKTDAGRFSEMLAKHAAELAAAMKNKKFAIDAFMQEFSNHEFDLTRDATDALWALGLSESRLANDEALFEAFSEAVNRYLSD